jgi:ferric-dicitrate binding protein FerR (iron transport regulator)
MSFTALALGYWTHRVWQRGGEKSSSIIQVATSQASRNLILPDGSTIYLNRNSVLTYPPDFDSGIREVHFTGEGLFDVESHPNSSFVVRTKTGNVEVLGTRFYLHERLDSMAVAVSEGKVEVERRTENYLLSEGMSLRLTSDTAIAFQEINENDWGFATGRFVFNDAPLSFVADVLERSYPIQIEIENRSARDCRLTATFEDLPVDSMLQLIAESLELTLINNESTHVLKGKGCR